ncbi:lysylphosphatidylglycerol synthase domain-containing protein [Microvirga sp. TS319]|uniref:lysylphosphatidylglycerol synthase domain-containing protein n=1 Tax=Microvirga sp. TS319 TaxID=3241165 RepID=UPI00351A6B8C
MHKFWKPLVAVVAVGLAAFLLYRTLSGYSIDDLTKAVAAIPVGRLVVAGGFAAASYICLSGFDYLALRYVGRPLPYHKAAWASFTSLSLGHNIGFAFLSSGAVRYRFYRRWGLSAEQVAKVVVFCGTTVGIGLMALGGMALLLRPRLAVEMTNLSMPLVITLGVICLALPVLYLVLSAFVRKPLSVWRWSFELPRLRLALGQVILGSVNFACVAACLYQALAAVTDVSYMGVASAYVIANTATIISHVPGGLGVIESVVMYLLPGQNLIGPLLVFRFVYFLIPLFLGLVVLLVTELVFRRKKRARAALEDVPAGA